MSIEIENFYSYIPKAQDETENYPNYNKINIKLTSRILICGPTSSGKTNITFNLIKTIGVFERIYLFCKNPGETLYKDWINKVRKLEDKKKHKLLYVSSDLKDLPGPSGFNKKYNNLLIIDDFVFENEKVLKPVSDDWSQARKNNVTMIFLSQSYYNTPKPIRLNSDILIFKKLNTVNDTKRILKEYSLGISQEQLLHLYQLSTKGDFRNFFMIDLKTNDNNLKFRKNFQGIHIQNEDDQF